MSKLSVTLHALPVLNISDYVTRSKSMGQKLLFGALFGTQTDNKVIINNAFELKLKDNGNDTDLQIDLQYLETKIQLYRTTFPEHDLVGWFKITIGPPSQEDEAVTAAIHKQVAELHDVSAVLVFDPEAESDSITSELPFKAYEPIFQGSLLVFEELSISIDTEEAEKIGVDEMAKLERKTNDTDDSGMRSRWQAHANAVEMFLKRLRLLQKYVKGVQEGKYPKDWALLRKIDAFMAQVQSPKGPLKGSQQKLIEADNEQSMWVLTEAVLALIYKGDLIMGDLESRRPVKGAVSMDSVNL